MIALPGRIPVTMPVEPTVATDTAVLLHVPPVDVVLSTVVAPWHIVVVPVIAFTVGVAVTVTVLVTKQPPAIV